SDLFRTSNQVVGCQVLQVVSRARVRGFAGLWLTRIDQEDVFVVRFSGRSRRVSSVWATRKGFLEFFDIEFAQGVEDLREVSNDDTAVAQRRLKDKQPEDKTNTDCLVKEQEKEYHTGRKIKTGNVLDSFNQRSTQQCMKSEVAKHLGVAGIKQENGLVEETNVTLLEKVRCFLIQYGLSKVFWADDTTVSTYLVNGSPSSAIEFKKPIDMMSNIEDNNKAPFAVAAMEKIYAHESLTFNNTVACEVISKWKAGLKDDMDARSDVYVLSNDCRKCSDDNDGLLDKAKGNVLGMEIVRDHSGYTLMVSQSRFYNGKLVSNDDAAVAQRRLKDKQPEDKTNTDCLVKEQEKKHLGIKV
nr:zinc finger, CCHC-type [Tanacetum cinerariifolium]